MKQNSLPLRNMGRVPNTAKLLRRLLGWVENGRHIDLWLTFPQNSCCFTFGPSKGPVPIGALFMLWSAGWPYLQECPECHGKAYMVACGGLLSIGGGSLICPTCESEWYQPLGGLTTVGRRYLLESPLKGTQFEPRGMVFGSACVSDGRDLCEFLGITDIPESGPGVSFEVLGHQLSLEARFDRHKM